MTGLSVLSVASEVYPLLKTGGLADVVAALPPALAQERIATRTLVPGYPAVIAALRDAETVQPFARLQGGPARLLATQVAGLDLFVLDAPHLFARPGNPYLEPTGRNGPTTRCASPRSPNAALRSRSEASRATRPTSCRPTTGRRASSRRCSTTAERRGRARS